MLELLNMLLDFGADLLFYSDLFRGSRNWLRFELGLRKRNGFWCHWWQGLRRIYKIKLDIT